MRLRPFVIISSRLVRKGYSGFSFFPFVVVKSRDRADDVLLNHEYIHFKQQLEMLVLPFYIWYFTEYLLRRFQHDSWHEAYMNISFEREAYAHECDMEYLSTRKVWAWWRWL